MDQTESGHAEERVCGLVPNCVCKVKVAWPSTDPAIQGKGVWLSLTARRESGPAPIWVHGGNHGTAQPQSSPGLTCNMELEDLAAGEVGSIHCHCLPTIKVSNIPRTLSNPHEAPQARFHHSVSWTLSAHDVH